MVMFKDLKRLFRHSFVYAIGSAMQSLVGFILIPVYTRYLLPAEYGQLEIINTILLILTMLLSFGFASAILKVHERDCKDENDRKIMIGNAFAFIIPTSFIITLILWWFAPMAANVFLGGEEFTIYIKIILATNVLAVFSALCFSILRSKERSKLYTLFYLVRFFLLLGINIYFVVGLRLNVLGILIGNLIAQAVISSFFIPVLIKNVKLKFSSRLLKKLFAFGLPIIPASLAMWVMDLSDRYYLKFFANFTEVGLYSLGYKIGMVVSVLLVVPFQLAWPTISFSIADQKNVKNIYSRVLTYFLIISSFLALILGIFAAPMIKVLSDPAYFEAYKIVMVIAFSYVLYGAHFILVVGLHLKEKTKFYPLLVGIPAVLNLILNLYFVPAYGMYGAAITTLICFAIIVLITYLTSNYFYKMTYEWRRIIKLGVVITFIIIVSFFIPKDTTLFSISMSVLLILCFPLGLYILKFFKQGELRSIMNVLKKENS